SDLSYLSHAFPSRARLLQPAHHGPAARPSPRYRCTPSPTLSLSRSHVLSADLCRADAHVGGTLRTPECAAPSLAGRSCPHTRRPAHGTLRRAPRNCRLPHDASATGTGPARA